MEEDQTKPLDELEMLVAHPVCAEVKQKQL